MRPGKRCTEKKCGNEIHHSSKIHHSTKPSFSMASTIAMMCFAICFNPSNFHCRGMSGSVSFILPPPLPLGDPWDAPRCIQRYRMDVHEPTIHRIQPLPYRYSSPNFPLRLVSSQRALLASIKPPLVLWVPLTILQPPVERI